MGKCGIGEGREKEEEYVVDHDSSRPSSICWTVVTVRVDDGEDGLKVVRCERLQQCIGYNEGSVIGKSIQWFCECRRILFERRISRGFGNAFEVGIVAVVDEMKLSPGKRNGISVTETVNGQSWKGFVMGG